MKKLALLSIFAFAPLLLAAVPSSVVTEQAARVVTAGRPKSILDAALKLNGSPKNARAITTATGADADSTALAEGMCVLIICTTETRVIEGTTCTGTGLTKGVPIAAAEKFYFCLSEKVTQFSTLATTAAGTCDYWEMM